MQQALLWTGTLAVQSLSAELSRREVIGFA